MGTAIGRRAADLNLSAGEAITAVRTTYGENLVGTSGTNWSTVTSVQMTVPAGEHGLVVARLDASASCEPVVEGVGDGVCQLRFKALRESDHRPMRPSSMTFALEVSGGIGEEDYSLTMEKSRLLPAGRWTVVVQHRVTDPSIYFGIYAHHFTVERASA